MTTSLITEAQEHIAFIGGEWRRDEKRPTFIERVARGTGLTKSAVERILYGKRKRLFADELLSLRERRAALQERRAKGETAHAVYVERFIAAQHGVSAQGASAAAEPGGGSDGEFGRDRAGVVEAPAAGRPGPAEADEGEGG
jgi:hypothetical protein